jgi:TPR repeat protein
MEDLQVDTASFSRMTCCGKAMHKYCSNGVLTSKMSYAQKSRCPECRQKVPTSLEEVVEQIRVWVDKGKAWAQTTLAGQYAFGSGVPQSYEKAIEYLNMAVQQGDPNGMFGLAECMLMGKELHNH